MAKWSVFKEISMAVLKTAVVLVAFLAVYLLGDRAYGYAYRVMYKSTEAALHIVTVEVQIPQGASTATIANILESNGLVDSAMYFRIMTRVRGNEGKYRAGYYTLNTGMDESDIMNILTSEDAQGERAEITVAEGQTVVQVARTLSTAGIATEEEFVRAVNSRNYGYGFVEGIPDRNLLLQGYLHPGNYRLYQGISSQEVVSILLGAFDKALTQADRERARELGLTLDEVVTIASLVEKEAQVEGDKALVSGLIHNRLAAGMNLSLPSTLRHVLNKSQERLLPQDAWTNSPYNTFQTEGLPPGPICNPGLDSIRAALYPAEHEYLYFTIKDPVSGALEFYRTQEEHGAALARYGNYY
ncbi:endolytic transglycosylase MltG [Anaerotalea alkaliphila]|uniref:Endolytic murein transglycosylase n=1 Tax=Anaerotalea alkaliphila TaxID=2662126 RepID=A0A7X5HX42_9FIRM|nr:endolytic transglycosylase MltG [Anaerotalea alkaliphila]NDL68227.1 endolytic transglycosylase MltG [Anaerotalea alkaliphila]